MATPRRLLVDPASSGVFHCVSRCVRRAFLCGQDAYSGRNYEHRRAWIRDRLRQLTSLFAIEVHAYAVMSNHLHLVVRTLPGQADGWEDAEVARRWLHLFPGSALDADPSIEESIAAFCQDRERLARYRSRLADLSWFMRCLNEPIARRANREDECSGRFWEGRFKCQKLDDAGAALACMAYVDLNPVRAGMAPTPEESNFTSAQDRAFAFTARRQLDRAPLDASPEQATLIRRAEAESTRDAWLAPIGPLPEPCNEAQPAPGGDTQCRFDGFAHRIASTDLQPLLAHLSVAEYLELLDYTGREIRSGKQGHLSPDLRPVLERLDLDVESWVQNVERFGGLFYRVAGKLRRLREMARATGRTFLRGQEGARRLYVEAA